MAQELVHVKAQVHPNTQMYTNACDRPRPIYTTYHALACRKYAQVGTRAEGNVRPADPAAQPEVTATPMSQQLHTICWGATQRVLAELVSMHA
jgi:hypothetical protein